MTLNNASTFNHSELQTLLADYRDLRGAARAAVDEHLRTCAACTARLAEYRAMDRDLADLRDARPDARLRAGYLAAIQPANLPPSNLQPATARRLPWLSGLVAAAAVLALVFGVLFVLRPGEPPRGGGGLQPSPTATSPAAAPTTSRDEAPAPTSEPAIMPTAASVTVTMTADAPRDPETTQVTLDIYSGMPNPVWTLTTEQTQELRELLDGLPEAACEPVNLGLGLRGFVVELGQRPELSNEYRLRVTGRQVRWGDPWIPGDPSDREAPTLCYSDVEGAVARFLLASGQAHMPEGVYALVEQDIEQAGAVPDGWLAYSDEVFGFFFAHPMTWEGPQNTEQSRLFYLKQDEPAGPAFPVFYVTVVPEGYTNADFEAYNFWSAEEVAAALALEPGASGPVHGAEGYDIYTRLSDVTTAAGLTGAVLESARVWEGGPDTRDRRVLLTHEGTLYMLGTYYTTPEELQVFEQVVASFEAVE